MEHKYTESANLIKLKEMTPYHPGLSTTQQANSEETRKVTFSDHVAVMAMTPEGFIVVSLNAAQSGLSGCGFAPESRENADYIETPNQENDRHQRIIDGLIMVAEKQKMDFLALQEISLETSKFGDNIVKSLKKYGYDCVKKDDEIANGWGSGQGIILYNTKKFELEVNPEIGINQFTHKGVIQGVKATFKITNSEKNEKITLLSVHGVFRFTPEQHEQEIDKFITGNKSKVLIVGDFNCSVVDPEQQNNVTSVSPPLVNEDNIQGAYALDGAFYSDNSNPNESACIQLKISHLNLSSGNVYSSDELKAIKINGISKEQVREITRFRMIICVEKGYKLEQLIDSRTIFQYQDYLRKNLGQGILVRRAFDLNTTKEIGICLSRELYELTQAKNQSLVFEKAVDYRTKKVEHYFVFARDENVLGLVDTMEEVIKLSRKLTPQEKEYRKVVDTAITDEIKKIADKMLTDEAKEALEILSNIRIFMRANPEEKVSDLLDQAIKKIKQPKGVDPEKKGKTRLNIITLKKEQPKKSILIFMEELYKKAIQHENPQDKKPDFLNYFKGSKS